LKHEISWHPNRVQRLSQLATLPPLPSPSSKIKSAGNPTEKDLISWNPNQVQRLNQLASQLSSKIIKSAGNQTEKDEISWHPTEFTDLISWQPN
jgi:hypothetical protein